MSAETLVPQGSAVILGSAGSYELESVAPLANGEFYMAWDVAPSNGDAYQLFGQEFTASGAPIGSPYDLSNGPSGNDQYGRPIRGFANPSAAALADGNIALSYFWIWSTNSGNVDGTNLVLLDSSGKPYFSETVNNPGGYNFVTALGNSNTLLLYVDPNNQTRVQDITPAGATVVTGSFSFFARTPTWTAGIGSGGAFLVGNGQAVDYFDGSSWAAPLTTAYDATGAARLANGEILLVEQNAFQGTSIYTQVFDPATDSLGAAQLLNASLPTGSSPSVVATPDGGYVVDWGEGDYATGVYVDSSGGVSAPFTVISPLRESLSGQLYATSVINGQIQVQYYTLQAGSVGTEAMVPHQPIQLSASQGWTSAAVLSNGALAVVDVQTSYGQADEQTYDATGKETGAYALPSSWSGYGAPHVAALPLGGFYAVTYAGSSNYEVYNANNQQVFAHNQYTSPTATFSALANGGYITMDPTNSNVFGLYNAGNGNVGWISLPSDAPGTPTVNALNGGGFVFTYAGTSHFDLYDASGAMLPHGDLGATGSQFAQGFASLAGNGNGFLEAWMSPDGSTYNGIATSLDIQAMGPAGAITPVMTVTQDLDPWHTQFKLQAHADGSVAVLWSEGGAAFGAEYANGAVGPAYSAGVLGGDLAHTVAVELPNDLEGFAWFQNGDAWAEIFNPATGTVQRVDLGPSSSSDLSTLHALPTAQGGLAVSWHQGSGVEAAVLDSAGVLGPGESLRGDLLGVNTAGQAVTVYDNGGGVPVMQTLTLNDGLFWVH